MDPAGLEGQAPRAPFFIGDLRIHGVAELRPPRACLKRVGSRGRGISSAPFWEILLFDRRASDPASARPTLHRRLTNPGRRGAPPSSVVVRNRVPWYPLNLSVRRIVPGHHRFFQRTDASVATGRSCGLMSLMMSMLEVSVLPFHLSRTPSWVGARLIPWRSPRRGNGAGDPCGRGLPCG